MTFSASSMLTTNWVCKSTHLARHIGCNEGKQRQQRPPETNIAFALGYHPVCPWRNLPQHDIHPGASSVEDFVGRGGSRPDFCNYQEAEAGSE
jgi:hypothetical protein